ncbi:MAG: 3'-5' exonuclease [Endomicrobium sp.]|jgi:DNA polymerase III epsilon subunit family exonuclease|nr:3'-5' exonuclease [Endomicrobium sp.]
MKYQTNVKYIFTNSPNNLVFLDIETTGLDPSKGAKIVEIAMLKIIDGLEYRYETLVNPGCHISQKCFNIHFICDNMIKNSPFFVNIAKDVFSFINGCVVVCHNANFDLSFVCRELYYAGIIAKNIYYIDTLKLARQYFNFKSNKLEEIATAVGYEMLLSHRAMADVLATVSIAKYFFANMYRKNINIIKPLIYEYNSNFQE